MMGWVSVPHPGNAQLVWLKLIKVYYKFAILCTLQSVINTRYNHYNVIMCILLQKQLQFGNNWCYLIKYVTNIRIRVRIRGASRAGIFKLIRIGGYANFDILSISSLYTGGQQHAASVHGWTADAAPVHCCTAARSACTRVDSSKERLYSGGQEHPAPVYRKQCQPNSVIQ